MSEIIIYIAIGVVLGIGSFFILGRIFRWDRPGFGRLCAAAENLFLAKFTRLFGDHIGARAALGCRFERFPDDR